MFERRYDPFTLTVSENKGTFPPDYDLYETEMAYRKGSHPLAKASPVTISGLASGVGGLVSSACWEGRRSRE